MTAWEYLRHLPYLWSRERFGYASNAEKKRWIQQGALLFNGEKMEWNEEIDFPIGTIVLFPNGKNRITLR